MKKIIVASKNPAKIASMVSGFKRMFPDEIFEVEGIGVASGVADQPMSDAETLQGAMNRTLAAEKEKPDADFWTGMEGGCEDVQGDMQVYAWIVVKSKNGNLGKGRTGTFILPQKIADLVREGIELAKADDIVFNRQNSGYNNGAVGVLTGDVMNRSDYYEHAVILALIPFKNTELYQPCVSYTAS